MPPAADTTPERLTSERSTPERPAADPAPETAVVPVSSGAAVGRVVLLRRFPLKSAGGDLPEEVDVDAGGLRADRGWAVTDPDGAVLRPRDHPWLAGLSARVQAPSPGGPAGPASGAVDAPVHAAVDVSDARGPLGSTRDPAALAAALSALAGTAVRVSPSAAGATGSAAVHVVSTAAAQDPGAAPGSDPGERANLVLALDPALAPGAERGWEGRRLRVGGAELLLVRRPRHCLGIYADVVRPGPVRLGDAAVLLDADPSGPAAAPGARPAAQAAAGPADRAGSRRPDAR